MSEVRLGGGISLSVCLFSDSPLSPYKVRAECVTLQQGGREAYLKFWPCHLLLLHKGRPRALLPSPRGLDLTKRLGQSQNPAASSSLRRRRILFAAEMSLSMALPGCTFRAQIGCSVCGGEVVVFSSTCNNKSPPDALNSPGKSRKCTTWLAGRGARLCCARNELVPICLSLF